GPRTTKRRTASPVPVRGGRVALDPLDRWYRNHRRNPHPRWGRRWESADAPGRRMSARLRVVVADDERPARSFLIALLRSFDDVTVVGEATSGKEVVALIEKEQPDFALRDLQMPELDGIGVVRTLKKTAMPL